MDFSWNDKQQQLHERMRVLGESVMAAPAPERLSLLAAQGVLGLSIDSAHGGGGWDSLTTAYAYEGLGATLADGGTLLAAGAHLFGVAMAIQAVGSPTQRDRWLPALAAGRCISTVAATEQQSGSNMGAIEAVVEPEGDGMVARGDKCFVTNAPAADLFLFVGRHGATGRGLTVALIEATAPGVQVGEPLQTAGLKSAQLAPVVFSGCQLSDDAILGRPGAGMAVFQIAMNFERALVLAFRLGVMQRDLDQAVAFTRTRTLDGKPIARHQAVLHRLARMKLRLETARLCVYRAAWALDQSHRAHTEAALAKWHLADAALESALDAMALRGGAGYLDEAGFCATIDDALGATIHSGTQDVCATIIGRSLM
jgi:alkylation response protein AidB-like acyl-CoA dehydrogenase